MKLAFFDAKPYDRPGFDAHAAGTGLEIRYFETKLGEDTVQLARSFDGVCVFVNDTVNAKVADELYRLGVRVIALRCAGFNNVDTRACRGRLRIFRVPAYSPYAVAEHAMALLLTVNRHTHKAYIRTRDFNFSLSGLTGFDLHGKTAGVVGTGKIGRVFAEICRGFGMRVLAYDKFPDPGSGLCYAALPELFHQADVISLHCPLTDETRHLIDAAGQHGLPRLYIGDALHAADAPDRAAADPEPVDHDPVKPVHDHEKECGLPQGRLKVRSAVPAREDRGQRGEHDEAERDHEAFALPRDGLFFRQSPPEGLLLIFLRIKIQAAQPVVPRRSLDQQEIQQAIEHKLQNDHHASFPLLAGA